MRVWLRNALWEKVPRDHWQTPEALRRRQLVTVVFVVVGGLVLALSLRIEPGNPLFYPATFALAGVWAVGAFASGPLHLGRIASDSELRRPVIAPIAIGLALAAIFVAGALVVREVPWLGSQVTSVLDFADQGSLPLLALITTVNGIAEELFFRGACYAATTRHPVVVTTVAYTLATMASGNVMLVIAAVLLGVVVGMQRRASGGILAPILTHCTWSLAMLFALPLVFS